MPKNKSPLQGIAHGVGTPWFWNWSDTAQPAGPVAVPFGPGMLRKRKMAAVLLVFGPPADAAGRSTTPKLLAVVWSWSCTYRTM
ncbi:MAG: hypothetical protein ACYS5W_13210 [Planctomycetota bacterium]|jgi:hypothetical protein